MPSLTLSVTGMTCGHCKAAVEKALRSVPGTFGATVFLEAGEAEVDHDTAVARADQYIEAVKAAGYAATVKA